MKQAQAAAAGMALLALICAGCSATTPAGSGPAASAAAGKLAATATPGRSTCASGGPVAPTSSVPSSTAASWPQRLVERQGPAEVIADQVINPDTGAAYALISRTNAPVRGPYILECTQLRTGSVHESPSFLVGSLATASGYLWVYGASQPGSQPVVYQVNPASLARIWAIALPPVPAGPEAAFATGPGDSVWIGSYRTLLRVAVSTGITSTRVTTRVTLPPGLTVSDISVDPAGTTLYVSAAHVVRGGMWGLVMLEYDARSGRLLAAASSGLLSYSVAGATLTAVPRGVWASFRTGMLGLTIHLSQAGLKMIAAPGPGIAVTAPTSVFHWPMYEATAYGGSALWVANQVGIVACLDPRTGQVRASEQVSQSQLIYALQADPARHVIYALSANGLLQITPPQRCWS
jgi:outer membrane protein assembly factor BamB